MFWFVTFLLQAPTSSPLHRNLTMRSVVWVLAVDLLLCLKGAHAFSGPCTSGYSLNPCKSLSVGQTLNNNPGASTLCVLRVFGAGGSRARLA